MVCWETLNTIQKPEALIERLVKTSSTEGDLVLDPFAGVGTSLVVCKKLERNYIGIEQNVEFVKIAETRVAEVDHEQKLRFLRYGT